MDSGPIIVSRESELPDNYCPRQSSAIWRTPPPDWRNQLAAALERGAGSHTPTIFFRADDIGAGGRAFEEMCRTFRAHNVPLAMAVVPAWISSARREQLFEAAPLDESLWGWHQHGWRHVNWQRIGKKSEFGEQRPFDKQYRDILQGRKKMQEIFGDRFVEVFSPPWNRMSHTTLKTLQQLEFKGVSLAGPLPRGARTPSTLKNLRIHIDLHTRKAKDPSEDFKDLLEELNSLQHKREPAGIMVHHHRMTSFAFEFLDELLYLLSKRFKVRLQGFSEIIGKGHAE